MKQKKVKTTFQTSSSIMAPPGPTHPCNYDSNANKISVSAQSILQANVRARMVEQDNHRLYKETGQWNFDEANNRIKQFLKWSCRGHFLQYTETVLLSQFQLLAFCKITPDDVQHYPVF